MPDLIPGSGFDQLLNQVAVPENLISSAGFSQTVNPQSAFENAFRQSMQVKQDLRTPEFVSPFSVDPSARFPLQVLGMDNEDIYAQGQSGWQQAWNATLKGGALAATTFVQSTLGLVNGIFAAASDGKFSSFYDNDFNRKLDDINKSLEDQLPNYYSAAERNSPWYTNIFTTNFIFDKIVKNLGFMAGAAGSGMVFSKLLQMGKLAASGNALKALQATEKAVAEGRTLDTLGDTASGLSSFMGKYSALNTGQKVLVSGLATVGEAGIEALQAGDQARTKLLEEFRIANGRDADGEDLKRIDDTAANIGNSTFALNTVLLTASNYIQFPKLLGASNRAERGMYSELVKKAENVAFDKRTLSYIQRIPTTKFGKLSRAFSKVQPYGPSITEGLEEGLQYAAQIGSENYWYKKYQNGENMNLGFLEGAKEMFGLGSMNDLYGFGLNKTFGTGEGQEQLFIGAISGAIGKARGTIREQRNKQAYTQAFIEKSNASNLTSYTKDILGSLNRGEAISTTMEDAVRQGDVLEYKDAERDFMINYLYPKVKHGRMDLFQDEIDSYKQLAATPDGFKQLQEQGKALPTDTREAYLSRLANLERVAESTKLAYQTLTTRNAFLTRVDSNGKTVPKYSDEVTEKMIYANSKIMDYDERISGLTTNLLTYDVDIQEVTNDPITFDKYAAIIDNLQEFGGGSLTNDKKEDLKRDLRDITELSLRRRQFIEEYNGMLVTPEKFEGTTAPTAAATIKITTKDGEEDIEIGTEYYLGKITTETEQGFLSEKYPILTVLAKNEDGSLRIRDGNGNISTISSEELKGYKLGKVSDVKNNPKASYFMKHRNRIFEYKFKDGKKPGVLRWSPTGDELFFEYDKNGKKHRIPVNNKDFSYKLAKQKGFNEPKITLTGATLTDIQDSDDLGDKEDKLNAKLAKRLGLITGFVTNSRKRLESLDKFIEDKKTQLKSVEDGLDNLTKTKAGIPRKRFTKAITKTLQELGETKGRLVNEISALKDEKEELEATLPYFEDLLANARELPEDTLELVKELKNEVDSLEEIIDNTNDAIQTAGEFVTKIDEALQRAYSLLNDYIKRLREENPNIPFSVEEYQTKLERYLGEAGAAEFIANNEGYTPLLKSILSDIQDFSEELEITPNENKISALQSQIKELREGLDNIVTEQLAKSKILEFFEEKIKEEKTRRAEEAAIMQNKDLQSKIFTSQKEAQLQSGDRNGANSVEQNQKELLEQQKDDGSKKKSAQVLFSSTSGRSETNVPDADASASTIRERNFLFNQTYFPTHVKQNMKGLVVTLNNEASLGLQGLVFSIARQNTGEGWNTLSDEDLARVVTDPDNGVALLVYTVERDGEFIFLDENGKELGKPGGSGNVADIERRRKEELAEVLGSFDEQISTWQEIKDYTGINEPLEALQGIYDVADKEGRVDRKRVPGQAFFEFTPREQELIEFINSKVAADSQSETIDEYVQDLKDRKQKASESRSDKNKAGRINIKFDEELAVQGESVLNINQVVASTLTSTAFTWRTDNISRVRDQDRDIAPEIASQWRVRREGFMNSTQPQIFDVAFSRGLPIYNEVEGTIEETSIIGSLFPSSETEIIKNHQGALKVITTDNYTHQDIPYKTIPGRVYFEYNDIFAPLSNRQFNSDEQDTIYNVLLSLATQAELRSTLKGDHLTYLRNVLYWRAPEEGKQPGRNQIWIDTEGGIFLNFGNSGTRILFTKTSLADNQPLIKAYLSGTYNNVNNHTLTNNFHDLFIEYYVENEELLTREHQNYQSFLIDREFIKTPIAPQSAVPLNGNRNFMQKYAIIQGVDYVIAKKEAPKKEEAPTPQVLPGLPAPITETEEWVATSKAGFKVYFTAKQTDKGPEVTITEGKGDIDKIQTSLVEKGKTLDEANEQILLLALREAKIKFAAQEKKEEKAPAPIVTPASSDIDRKRKEVRSAIQKAGQGEGGIFKVTLIDNTSFSLPRISVARDEVFDPQGSLVDIGLIIKIENPDGTVIYTAESKPGMLPAPDTEYRPMNTLSVDRMSEEEKKDFQAFLKQNLPQFNLREIEHFIKMAPDRNAWGSLQGKLITLYSQAEKGTGYHEAFEAVWKYFVLPEEQEELLSEFKNRQGFFNDRVTNTRISYNEANDKQAKEELADEFARYKTGQKLSLGQRIKKFFDRIINFFRSFNKGYKPNTELRDKLFTKIESGAFSKTTLPAVLPQETEYASVRGLSEARVHAFVQDMTKRLFINLLREQVDLFEPSMYNRSDIKDIIKRQYSAVIPGFPNGEQTFEDLWSRTKEFLKTFRIEFDENNTVTINDENQTKNDYYNDKMTLDVKKSSPFAIKYMLASLAKTLGPSVDGGVTYNVQGIVPNAYQLIPFAKTFITLLEALENSTSFTNMIGKLKTLSQQNSDFIPLLRMLGVGGITINWNNLTKEQWRSLTSFYNTFNKQKPAAKFLTYDDLGQVYFSSAEIGRASETIKRQWESNIRHSAKQSQNLFVGYDRKTKNYAINETELKRLQKGIFNPDTKIEFLNGVGVTFDRDTYNKLNKEQRESFNNSVDSIVQYLSKNKGLKVITGKSLGVSGPINQLAELHARVTFSQSESTFISGKGEQKQTYVQPNYLSQLADIFNQAHTLEDLYNKLPYLRTDPYAQGSEILKIGGKFFNAKSERTATKLVLGYTDSVKEGQKGITIADLEYPQRITTQINNTLEGIYYVGVPADSSTEWSIEMGEFIDFTRALNADIFKKHLEELMFKYLKSEIALAKEASSHSNLSNVGTKAQELRFFKDILSPNSLRTANRAISTNQPIELTESIKEDIDKYIRSEIISLRENLEYNQELSSSSSREGYFQYPNLVDSFIERKKLSKDSLSPNEVDAILRYTVANNIVANMEMHKIFFGDPYNFAIKDKNGKVILDETKRIKSFLSPAIPTLVSDNYNNTFNREFNTIGNTTLTRDTPGFYSVRNTVNSVTFSDVITQSQYVTQFTKNNEADAQALHTLQMHRDLLTRHGQWSKKASDWYNWEMAYTRQELFKKGKFTNYPEALQTNDKGKLKKPKPEYTLHIIKPIVRGIKSNSVFLNPVLDKFSSAPLFYSAVQGTHLEDLFIKMFQENIDYVIFESGRKVGAEGKNSFYTENGSFNNTPYTGRITINWKDYAVQVENAYDKGKTQTRGSQITKLFSLDFFSNGVPIDYTSDRIERVPWNTLSEEAKIAASDVYKEIKWNNKLLEEMTKDGYETLISRLGLVDNGDRFIINDIRKLYSVLEDEAGKRDMPENIKKVFRINPETGLPFLPLESTSEYTKIQKMLYSMVDSSILSPKVSGGPKTQLSVFGWESNSQGRSLVQRQGDSWVKITQEEYNNLSATEKRNVRLTSNTLKFYTPEDPYIEVMLPHWFKEKFKKAGFTSDKELLDYLNKEDKDILKGIGFRIPTSNMTAIEAIRVKGFLPQEFGDTIVLPTEITTKAGSDFDIDKLNTYLKNVYLDGKNKIKIVPFYGFGDQAKDQFKTLLATIDIESILQVTALDEDFEEDTRPTRDYDELASILYKQSLENEYFSSLEKVITNPLNFDRLTEPTDNDTLSNLAGSIAELTGATESNKLTRLLSINYLSKLRHAFLAGKKWVGIGAVNNTGHSQSQRASQYIDVANTTLSQRDRDILGDGAILLPHNRDSQGRPTLSGTKDQSNNFISSKLGWYLTAFVDIAKDPYILSIIPSRKLVGTFLFLERLGVNTNTLGYFMNQPIIREYIHFTDVNKVNRVSSLYYRDLFLKADTRFNGEAAENVNVDTNRLRKNISDFYIDNSVTQDWRNQQRRILNEFIKYTKMAEHLFMASQATNWDTARFSTGAAVRKKELLLQKQRTQNIIKSPDDILQISNNGKIMDAVLLSKEAIDSLSPLTSAEIRDELNKVLDRYVNLSFISETALEKIDSQILNSFVDYLVQTKLNLNGSIRYLVSDATTSIAARVFALQGQLSANPIFQNLKTVFSNRENDADNIRLAPFPKDVYDKNLITEYLDEIKELPTPEGQRPLYRDLVALAILQGTGNQFNLLSYIPIEDVGAVLQQVVGPVTREDARNFASNFNFERNQWKNTDVVMPLQPVYPRFQFPLQRFGSRVLRLSDLYNNKLGIVERPLITLERFHKIPKTPNRIDLTSNSIVRFNDTIKDMIANFDFSFTDKVGYQKVFLPGSTIPLTQQEITRDGQIHNYYYYKQVNLLGSNGIQEHYTTQQPSVLNNGTVKVDPLDDQTIVDAVLNPRGPQAPGQGVAKPSFEEFKNQLKRKDCK